MFTNTLNDYYTLIHESFNSDITTKKYIIVCGSLLSQSILSYSYDGRSWKPSSNGNTALTECHIVIYSNGQWMAGGIHNLNKNNIAYSKDGINWIPIPIQKNIFNNYCNAIEYNDIWVIGGENTNSNNNTIAYSNDGLEWFPAENTIFNQVCYSIKYSNKLWVAGGSGINKIAYSHNGKLWYPSTSGNILFKGSCSVIKSNNNIWLAGGTADENDLYGMIAYSTDGINWTSSPSGNNIITKKCLTFAYNENIWLAGGIGNNTIAYSIDNGISWLPSKNGHALLTSCTSIIWNGELWIACGSGLEGIAYSLDGYTWYKSTNYLTSNGQSLSINYLI